MQIRAVLPLVDVVIGTEDEINAAMLDDPRKMSLTHSQVSDTTRAAFPLVFSDVYYESLPFRETFFKTVCDRRKHTAQHLRRNSLSLFKQTRRERYPLDILW